MSRGEDKQAWGLGFWFSFFLSERLLESWRSTGELDQSNFANVYLNEFDRFVVHALKPNRYIRYGDDCLLFCESRAQAEEMRRKSIIFLQDKLGLAINRKNDIIVPVRRGIHFLGTHIFPSGTRLTPRNRNRIKQQLCLGNIPSYYGLVGQHENEKRQREFNWLIVKQLYDS